MSFIRKMLRYLGNNTDDNDESLSFEEILLRNKLDDNGTIDYNKQEFIIDEILDESEDDIDDD